MLKRIDNLLKQEMSRDFYAPILKTVTIILLIVLFLLSIDMTGLTIGEMAVDRLALIIEVTSNPFVGLFVGLLSTALLQSSSTTTSITVAAVASGAIELQDAIPIVMGANIGTTITSTIVSMSFISNSEEFKKAVSVGTTHDFFNILSVLIFFPLEIHYHLLEHASLFILSFFSIENLSLATVFKLNFTSFAGMINVRIVNLFGAVVSLILAIVMLFACIKFISRLFRITLTGKTKNQLETIIFSNRLKSFGWGLILTSGVQSSSLITSLIVPLVTTGKVRIIRAFQFILGANIGTTITAFFAAIFKSDAAISLAMVHFLFNLIGVLIFLFVPYLNKLPIYLAEQLGAITARMRIFGFIYILTTFFLIPFMLIYASEGFKKDKSSVETTSDD